MDSRRGRDGRAARPERGLIEDGTFGGVVRWIDDRNDTPGPLSGLRIGVKDNIDVAGVETTCASEFFEHNVADADAEVVTRLRRAGGSVVAKLNMWRIGWCRNRSPMRKSTLAVPPFGWPCTGPIRRACASMCAIS